MTPDIDWKDVFMDLMQDDDYQIGNPFQDNASKYEAFLYKQMMQQAAWLFAMSKKIEELEKVQADHARAHNVASAHAMRMSPTPAEEEKVQ